jgi:predicted CXXCH cytochrome family protein
MQRARLYYKAVLAVVVFVALGAFLGCSSQKHYRMLSFFFDGVPAPGGQAGVALDAAGQPVAYLHKPYADGKCASCHASDELDIGIDRPTNISAISSSVCLNCHAKVLAEYKTMHGPVASAQCMLCHMPHQSNVAHLLNTPAPRLCVQCHAPETMTPHRPEHQDSKADCLTCHSGHGGATPGLLHTDTPPTAQPATQPTVSSLPLMQGGAGL